MDRTPYYHPAVTTVPVDPNSEGAPNPGASSGPAPHVLDPGYGPQTVHRSDLFFTNSSPHMNTRKKTEFSQLPLNTSPSPISTQLYPYHQQSFHHYAVQPQSAYPNVQNPAPPYDHRQRSATVPERQLPFAPPPPIPPRPVMYPVIAAPTTQHEPFAHTTHSPPPQPPPFTSIPEQEPEPSPIDDSNELAMALALSQSESVQRKLQEEKEEQDLARALMESMLLSGGTNFQDAKDPFPSTSVSSLPSPKLESTTLSTNPSLVPLIVPTSQNLTSISQTSDMQTSTVAMTGNAGFGRSEKWHMPEQPPTDAIPSSYGRKGSVSTKPDFLILSASLELPNQNIPPARPLSVSSASSLPYTMPSPQSNTFGSTEPTSETYQDGSDYPTPPATVFSDDSQQDGSDLHQQPAATSSELPRLHDGSPSTNVEPDTVLVFDDEAYARQLAAEEEEFARQEQHSYNEKRRAMEIRDELAEAAPTYQFQSNPTQWQSTDVPLSHNEPYQTSPKAVASVPGAYQPKPLYPNTLPVQQELDARPVTSISEPTSSTSYSPVVYPSLGTRHESESDTHSVMSQQSSTRSSASAPIGQVERIEDKRRPSLSGISPQSDGKMPGGSKLPTPVVGLLNPNQFLDRELLLGVSIGFKAPAISTRLLPMQDPMPNIISIPYSRCPPLHLQAPDWRHLLRLMARLSGTRIEPTVEAMAVSKTDLKLRTVIQFIKPHPSLNEWRTILWFTIDQPIPPNTPGAARYTSGNPNLLPWSYNLSAIPILLRDASDTQISKTYTVPPTETVPLPNLPITFPNLALYLQAVLDDSRRHTSDPISLGKLGKMVQSCYPSVEQEQSEFDIPGRSTVGHLFKRVIGRNSKDKKKGKTTNNEETYQLVTPFVPDEWG